MSTFQIKIVAILFMVIDHVGFMFFPQFLLFRIIGRLSFPLFAWLIANGAFYTKNSLRYLYRLLVFAFISQIPFWWALSLIHANTNTLNIFFTLSLGLLVIIVIQKTDKVLIKLMSFISACFMAWYFNFDYGLFGVAVIVLFYLFLKKRLYLTITQCILFVSYSFYGLIIHNLTTVIAFIGLLSLQFIWIFNKHKGFKHQRLLYLVYPGHLFILCILKWILSFY